MALRLTKNFGPWSSLSQQIKKTTSRQTSIKNREGIINDKVKVAENLSNANMNVGEYTAGKKPLSILDLVNVSFVNLILF